MSIHIAVIGAGQLGSRHLQALARLDRPASVHVVDPSADALELARARLEEARPAGQARLQAQFHTGLRDVPAHVHVAIVATTADRRREVVEELLATTHADHLLLEKVVFQRSRDFPIVSEALRRAGTAAWVNCPRRMYPFYRMLRDRLGGESEVRLEVTGASWGLGSNAIHMLDLLAFLTGDSVVACTTEALDAASRPSKREGFVDFTGTLTAMTSRGHAAVLTSHATGSAPLIVQVRNRNHHAVIDEGAQRAVMFGEPAQWSMHVAPTLLQSQLTHSVVQQLVDTNECGLTPFDESARLHEALLRALGVHLGDPKGGIEYPCPIT